MCSVDEKNEQSIVVISAHGHVVSFEEKTNETKKTTTNRSTWTRFSAFRIFTSDRLKWVQLCRKIFLLTIVQQRTLNCFNRLLRCLAIITGSRKKQDKREKTQRSDRRRIYQDRRIPHHFIRMRLNRNDWNSTRMAESWT
jgi:hypothetical protein